MEYSVELLEELRLYLKIHTGITYFSSIRNGPTNIMISCPFHKEGQESKPSCGLSKVYKGSNPPGILHCFTCGKSMSLYSALREILGDRFNKEEIEDKFHLEQLELETSLFTQEPLFKLTNTAFISEAELRKYRYYHTYLKNRNISESTANRYDIGYDKYNNQITFPIRDKYRRCLAIGRRWIDYKRYEYPQGFEKPLYGIYELDRILRYVFITEGPFNVWSLREYGKNGIGLLGTGTKNQMKELLTIDCDRFYFGDGSEIKLEEKLMKS